MIARIALPALLAPYRAKLGTATGFRAPTGKWGNADGPASASPPLPRGHRRCAAGGRRFLNKYFRTQHLLRSGDSIRVLDQPIP
jgi:hypothetical protein